MDGKRHKTIPPPSQEAVREELLKLPAVGDRSQWLPRFVSHELGFAVLEPYSDKPLCIITDDESRARMVFSLLASAYVAVGRPLYDRDAEIGDAEENIEWARRQRLAGFSTATEHNLTRSMTRRAKQTA